MSKLTSVISAPTPQLLYFQRLDEENEVTIDDPIKNLDSLSTDDGKRLAESIARALALLESELRRTQFVDEVIRWLARESSRDILSFRERVSSFSHPRSGVITAGSLKIGSYSPSYMAEAPKISESVIICSTGLQRCNLFYSLVLETHLFINRSQPLLKICQLYAPSCLHSSCST